MAPLVYVEIYILIMILTKIMKKVKLKLQTNYFQLFIIWKVAIVIKISNNIANANRTYFPKGNSREWARKLTTL